MRCCSRLEYLGQVLPLQWNILHNDGILTSLECLTNLRSLIKRVIKRRSQPDSLRCINIFVHVFLFLFLWIIFKYGRHWGKGGGISPHLPRPRPRQFNSVGYFHFWNCGFVLYGGNIQDVSIWMEFNSIRFNSVVKSNWIGRTALPLSPPLPPTGAGERGKDSM